MSQLLRLKHIAQTSWLHTKCKDLHWSGVGPPHVTQQKPKPTYCFVTIALRVTCMLNLSPTCDYQSHHSDHYPGKGEVLGSPHPGEQILADLQCQQSWNLGLVQQPPATLFERICVTICKGCRFRVHRVKLPKRIFLESWVIIFSAQESIPHPTSYFLTNWTACFSASKQIFYCMTMWN